VDDVNDVLTYLRRTIHQQDLIERARSYFQQRWDGDEKVSEYSFAYEDVGMEYKFEKLVFRHAARGVPYIATTLTLIVRGLQMGSYTMTTNLDGSFIDDCFELDDPGPDEEETESPT
jgi:hypothetical protein